MANVVRTDPFRDLARFDPFRDFDAGFWGMPRLRRWLSELPSEPTMKIDVVEDEKAFHVKADLPGVKKEDIDIQIDGNQVSLSAEVRRQKEEKQGETVVHAERYCGRQCRSFTLATMIDEKSAQAKFADGVLELMLPKSTTAAQHKVAIQ